MAPFQFDIKGLTSEQVLEARKHSGYNQTDFKNQNRIIAALKTMSGEPMILILLVAASIYMLMGNYADAIFLTCAILLVATISIFQQTRSNIALEKIKEFAQPPCKVIRNGIICEVKSTELVLGDSIVIEEGTLVPADGIIATSNDFSVNESLLTGESLSVFKDHLQKDNLVFQGTTVSSGLAIATVTSIGNQTRLGEIGKSLQDISTEKTPLESQINDFVKKMVIFGAIVFVIMWATHYYHSRQFLDSLLQSLTIAMSILPEEIPVAFATFMAMGAWRLMKMGIVVKDMKTVETLGSATVICTDKTGTITENKMSLAKIYVFGADQIVDPVNPLAEDEKELITTAMWASEPIPFDPMEIALHKTYEDVCELDRRPSFKIVHEYPLGGQPPMMTHIFENDQGERIIAAKGAPEAILNVSKLSDQEKTEIEDKIRLMGLDGYRILAVGQSFFLEDNFPTQQQQLPFTFKGLVAFYDPPKKNIHSVFKQFESAGIQVKIITGDNAVTTSAIARQIGIQNPDNVLTGEDLVSMNDDLLKTKVMDTQIFARMFPQAKLAVIQALKRQGQIVAMTGDGMNDGPALKAAHIGIAMGQKGTEIARQAASMILLNDDLEKMVDAVAMGRKIYENLKKAIRYIISIHIPIILTVLIPLIFNWKYPNIFSVVHIIFLELIMGPTCSIIFENEPMEKDLMLQKPRPFSDTFFNLRELSISIIQGLMISAGALMIYQFALHQDYNEQQTRTMTFATLITANIMLTLVNRSFVFSIATTMRYQNKLIPAVIFLTLTLTGLMIFVPSLAHFFEFETITLPDLFKCIVLGTLSVIWFEAVKYTTRKHHKIN
jgi:Ca2+-transporting ATPase